MAGPNLDQFENFFRRADLDGDGRISGAEAVGFFQGSGLPKQVLAQIIVTSIDSPYQTTPNRSPVHSPLQNRKPPKQVNDPMDHETSIPLFPS